MKTVYIKTRVAADGSLTITDLPPDTDVMVAVQPNDTMAYNEVWAELRESMKTHPFATMSREEILAVLRQTREEVARELYGD